MMVVIVDTRGHERAMAQSKALLQASQKLCAEAGVLRKSTRAARASSVSIRRMISVPSIRGGVQDGNSADEDGNSTHNEARRALIREKLAGGQLPLDPVDRLWGGPGRGELCDGCGAKVQPPALIMEALTTMGRALRLHV